MMRYLVSVGVALSVLVNALTGGHPLETLSFRSAKARADGRRWGCLLCRLLDSVDRNHCQNTLDWWARHFRDDDSENARADASEIDTDASGTQPQ